MSIPKQGKLLPCQINTNCVLVIWEFSQVNQAFDQLIEIASNIPRTTTIEKTNNYWHGVCRSLFFRFPDDLEILKLPSKQTIQVRSASRVGIYDLGVNAKRIQDLYKQLTI